MPGFEVLLPQTAPEAPAEKNFFDEPADVSTDTGTTEVETDESSADLSHDEITDEHTDETVEQNADGNTKVTKQVDLSKTPFKQLPKDKVELFAKDKSLKELYLRNREFHKHFESPNQAAETIERINHLGGAADVQTAIANIESSQQEWATIDTMFAAGDPAIVDKMSSTEFADGFLKIAPNVMNKFKEMDTDGYLHEVCKYVNQELHSAGVYNNIAALFNKYKDDPEGKDLIEKIANVFLNLQDRAKNQPKRDMSPELQKLKEREDALNRKEVESEQAARGKQTVSDIESLFTKFSNFYVKGQKVDDLQFKEFKRKFADYLGDEVTAQPGVKQQLANLMSAKDWKGYDRYLFQKLEKAAPNSIRKAMRATGIKLSTTQKQTATTATNTAGTGTQGKFEIVQFTPAYKEWDVPKMIKYAESKGTTLDKMVRERVYILKNGKQVRVKKV